jgi:hypothetical protein
MKIIATEGTEPSGYIHWTVQCQFPKEKRVILAVLDDICNLWRKWVKWTWKARREEQELVVNSAEGFLKAPRGCL